ncbi:MAG: type IV toxin-antitoxin system AbiEi family antitoxin [Acidobacteriota bacterium]
MKLNGFETQAKQALKQCLADIPFLEISEAVATRRAGPDLVLRIELPQGQRTIIAECKDSGQPRWIREAVNQILRYKESFPDAYPAVIAPYISPAAAEICRREGVGYADLAGNCWLAFDQVYIRKEGQPNPFSERRELRSLYSPKASRILRVLLLNPKRTWRMQELAQEADVSLGLVAKVKKSLIDREWIRDTDEGVYIVQPEDILSQWSAQYDPKKNKISSLYSLLDRSETEEKLAALSRRKRTQFALTGFSGAARVAPFVRYGIVSVYVAGDLDALAAELDLKRVPTGANLELIIPYDEGVFYQIK